MSRRLTFTLMLALVLGFSLRPALAQREPLNDEEQAYVEKNFPDAKKLITGVRYIIHKEGTGDTIHSGDKVSVYYKGMLMNGTVFNECAAPAAPFTFRVGRGEVIAGWDQVLKLLNEGSKATVVIPYEYAYGTLGNPPAVPRQAMLVFEVEVLKIERSPYYVPPVPADQTKKKKK